jgi:hypothetical protein
MSAASIIDIAPLGALIRYSDGTLKPPARFTKKLAAWERANGVGRLVKKEPPRSYPTWTAPASFTLHEGNFSSEGVILVTVMRSHSADSLLRFEVAEVPKSGQVRVLLDFGGATELLHLAQSREAADLWVAKEGYRNARFDVVGESDDGEEEGRGAGRRVSPPEPLKVSGGPAPGGVFHHPKNLSHDRARYQNFHPLKTSAFWRSKCPQG